jgi:colanic acid biosynthesis protein WcaH
MDPKRMQVEVVRRTPMVSIDLVIEDGRGRVLVGMRINEPAKGCWFVPGGRVLKDERLDDAYARVLFREVGWRGRRQDAEFLGAFEHFYDANFAGEPDVTTHYVVLSYRLVVPDPPPVTPDDQHEHLEWMPIPELLAHPAVHENTKVYFRRVT